MKILFTKGMLIFCFACNSQDKTIDNNVTDNCNREVYGRPEYLDKLPEYLCIPDGYIVDNFVVDSDLDGDGEKDFIAMKYNKKKDNQKNGDLTYYSFFYREKGDTVFKLRNTLKNLVPPFIESHDYGYLAENKVAADLYDTYPLRLWDYYSAFNLKGNTLVLSYKYDDTEGKSFLFKYNQSEDNWFLEKIHFMIAELAPYWWREGNFYDPLREGVKYMYTTNPKVKVSIEDFDLKEAFKYEDDEDFFISQNLMNQLNDDIEKKYKTISDFKFAEPKEAFDPPEGWKY